MFRFVFATALLTMFSFGAAFAETIPAYEGLQATMGAVTLSIYYQPSDAGYRVVTTASTDEPNSVIRFVSTLAPGQDATVSVPRGVGQPAIELRVQRIGDHLELQRPAS